MSYTTPDPITSNTERVLTRGTVTGFEQGIAAVAGFFTAGPLGALASWGTIRGVQGKWAPWFILGVPGAFAINVVNIMALAVIGGAADDSSSYNDYSYRIESSAPISRNYEAPDSSSSFEVLMNVK